MTSSEILRESGRRLFGIGYDSLGPSGKKRRRKKTVTSSELEYCRPVLNPKTTVSLGQLIPIFPEGGEATPFIYE